MLLPVYKIKDNNEMEGNDSKKVEYSEEFIVLENTLTLIVIHRLLFPLSNQ